MYCIHGSVDTVPVLELGIFLGNFKNIPRHRTPLRQAFDHHPLRRLCPRRLCPRRISRLTRLVTHVISPPHNLFRRPPRNPRVVKTGDGEQMCGMVSGLGSVRGYPRPTPCVTPWRRRRSELTDVLVSWGKEPRKARRVASCSGFVGGRRAL
jgi:hypothetical protein